MNADRNVGSVSVPVPASVTITNMGFHDVAYHDGDGPGDVSFSSADWAASQAGGAVTWSTETLAQNDRANAIRWGTLYNFRFDADAAPRPGTITLGLWRPGSPASITGTADVPDGTNTVSTCPGDGTAGACPCGNAGSPGRGCQNSAGSGGALLGASGNASLAGDTLVFTSAGELPSSFSIVLQGDVAIAPVVFGDGLRCTGGVLKRLYKRSAVGGVLTAPQGVDPSVSARSAALGDSIPAGGTRHYQVYYRDASPTFCPAPPGSTYNASSGLRIVWDG
jgi:hypothetical protein